MKDRLVVTECFVLMYPVRESRRHYVHSRCRNGHSCQSFQWKFYSLLPNNMVYPSIPKFAWEHNQMILVFSRASFEGRLSGALLKSIRPKSVMVQGKECKAEQVTEEAGSGRWLPINFHSILLFAQWVQTLMLKVSLATSFHTAFRNSLRIYWLKWNFCSKRHFHLSLVASIRVVDELTCMFSATSSDSSNKLFFS